MVFQDVFELGKEVAAFMGTTYCLCLVSFLMAFQVVNGRKGLVTFSTLVCILSSIMHSYMSSELGPVQGVVITLFTLVHFSFLGYWDIMKLQQVVVQFLSSYTAVWT